MFYNFNTMNITKQTRLNLMQELKDRISDIEEKIAKIHEFATATHVDLTSKFLTAFEAVKQSAEAVVDDFSEILEGVDIDVDYINELEAKLITVQASLNIIYKQQERMFEELSEEQRKIAEAKKTLNNDLHTLETNLDILLGLDALPEAEQPKKKPAAKKKATAKPAAKKTTAKKTTAKKEETAKKPAAKKTTTKKEEPAAKKPAAKKTTAAKPAAKKTTASKPAAAKKTTTAKPAAKPPVKEEEVKQEAKPASTKPQKAPEAKKPTKSQKDVDEIMGEIKTVETKIDALLNKLK